MKSNRWYYAIVMFFIGTICFPVGLFGKDIILPEELKESIEYFHTVSTNRAIQSISLPHLKKLIDFIETPKNPSDIYYSSNILDSSGAYYDFDVNVTLDRIVEYIYNINLPSHLFSPAAIRMCLWSEADEQWKKFSIDNAKLPNNNQQVIMRGIEYVVTTPDVFSGAYYGYFIDRTIIICQINERIVLISLSKQKEPSSVGKKGFVIGDDDEWNYFYSGEKGLTKPGIGWADTYMYDSFSITIQFQSSSSKKQTKVGVFSWVNAGWAGINVVKPKHIHHGLIRYGQCFKEVLESPLLPKPEELIRVVNQLNTLPANQLRNIVQNYYVHLFEMVKNRTEYEDKLSELVQNPNIYEQMTIEEMKAFLLLEYMKHALDKNLVKEKKFFLAIKKISSNKQ